MSDELSTLNRARPDHGKAQWVEGQCTGIAKDEPERTHLIGIPPLMPGTIIFVHGVNSEGEWYESAAGQFASGLNSRLGRTDLQALVPDPNNANRFMREVDGQRAHSPILPFYWGYSANGTGPDGKPNKRKLAGREDVWVDRYGNALESDGTWGGGPFQNGTNSLLAFWQEGFRRHVLGGMIDLNALNPIVGRELNDCPDRRYYVHAARRLARLVATIREDFPDEPVNIVSHSQGTMVALCALFYLKEQGVRGPDTVMLNSSPYHFETFVTDWLSAAQGSADVQSEAARLATFAAAAAIVQDATQGYPQPPAPATACTFAPRLRHAYDDRIYVQHPPGHPDWQRGLGVGAVDAQGRGWWQVPAHARDNRGRLFVNFNPGDRVIGVSAVAGMGWRGIPSRLLSAERNAVGANVVQRIFVRSSAEPHNPPVGSRSGYRQPYYHMQLDRLSVQATYNGPDGQPLAWRTGSGGLLQVEQENWHYMDGGSANRMWKVASERVLGLVPVLGDLSPRGEGGQSEFAYINAPVVPRPASLDEEFDQKVVRYDGDAQGAADGQPAVATNAEQHQDFLQDAKYAEPQLIHDVDERGFSSRRYETYEEVLQRRRRKDGGKVISPTNHAQILRYASPLSGAGTVKDVLAYDLTIGPGYAFGDEAYWDYLLKLADWRVSDPYAVTGVLTEKGGIEHAPAGISRETQAVVAEGRRVEAGAFDRAYGAP